MNRKSLLVFSVLAAALACRVYFAANFPVTLDEAWSDAVGRMPMSALVEETRKDISPPMTYLMHKFFTVSRTALGIRWLFVLFGFLSIFYLIKFIDSEIRTLLLLGFSAYMISEGAIARMHIFSVFFSSAACYYYAMTFEREKVADFALLALFSLLGLYNFYPFGALVAGFSAVYLIFRKHSVSRPAFYAYAFWSVVVLALPLFYFFRPGPTAGFASSKFINIPTGAICAYLPYALAYSEYLMGYQAIRGIKIVYFLALFAVIAPVFVRSVKNMAGDLKLRLSIWIALISFGIVFAVSLKIPKVLYSAKYVDWAYPLFAYIFIRGLGTFTERTKNLLLSAVLAVNFGALYSALNYYPENWKKVAAFLQGEEKEQDVILLDAGHMKYPFNFYYSGKGKVEGLPEPTPFFEPRDYMAYNRIWLILAHNWDRPGVYRELISRTETLSGEYAFGEIKILLFERRGVKEPPPAVK